MQLEIRLATLSDLSDSNFTLIELIFEDYCMGGTTRLTNRSVLGLYSIELKSLFPDNIFIYMMAKKKISSLYHMS